MKKKYLIFSLLALFLFGYLAYLVDTDFGKVQVKRVHFPGDDGKIISGLLYIPNNASNETPAPGYMSMHGYLNSAETQSGFNVEMSRRGFVVLSLDMSGHGMSEQTKDWGSSEVGRGTINALDFFASLEFVDKNKIVLEGHSMGGDSMVSAAMKRPELVNTLILEGSGPGFLGSPMMDANVPFNFVVVFSEFDEFPIFWGASDPREARATDKMKTIFNTSEPVEAGKWYGDPANKSGRILYTPPITHPGDHLSKEAIGYAISTAIAGVSAPINIDVSNQVWHIKEALTLLMMVCSIIFLFLLGGFLLDTSAFKMLKEGKGFDVSIKGKARLPVSLIIMLLPAVLYLPLMNQGAKAFAPSKFWPELFTNQILLWNIFLALGFLLVFLCYYFLIGKKQGVSITSFGLVTNNNKGKIQGSYVLRSLGFAITLIYIAHLVLWSITSLWNVDYRFFVVGFKFLDRVHLSIFFKYVPFYVLAILVNNFATVAMLNNRVETKDKISIIKDYVYTALVGGIGMIGFAMLHVIYLKTTYKMIYGPASGLNTIVAYQFAFILPLTSLLSTFFYRKTKNIWTGAFVVGILITWYIVAGQFITIPY